MPLRGSRRLAVSLVAVVAAVQGPAGSPGARAQTVRPNVLIILTDDQRADALSVMRRTRQEFASRGATFVNAYATTPVCCPSRASIMTGRYVHNHGVKTNGDAELLDQRSTLQRYLQDAGYLTAIAGKYLNSWTGDPPYFDEWSTFTSKGAGYYGATYNTGGTIQRVPTYSTDYIASETIRFLRDFETRDDRPWLLYVAPYAPHAPQKPARRHRRTPVPGWYASPAVQEQDRTDKPPWVLGKRLYGKELSRLRRTRAGQIRTLRAVDDLVDGVTKTLSTLGEEDRTMAFFLSDNGFLWGEHGLKQKQAPYTESVRIPFLLRWPGHVTPGSTQTWPVATIDIVPTVLQAAEVIPDPRYPVDGRSLLESTRRRVLLEFFRRGQRAVPTWASTRTESYQYTEWYADDGQTIEFREYYDLLSDPWQLTNLLGDPDPSNDPPPEDQTELATQLARDRRCTGTTSLAEPEPEPTPTPEPPDTPTSCP